MFISHVTLFSRRMAKMEKKGLTLMASSLAMLLYRKPSGIGSFRSQRFKSWTRLMGFRLNRFLCAHCAPSFWLIKQLLWIGFKFWMHHSTPLDTARRHSHVGGISLRRSFGRGNIGNHFTPIFCLQVSPIDIPQDSSPKTHTHTH